MDPFLVVADGCSAHRDLHGRTATTFRHNTVGDLNRKIGLVGRIQEPRRVACLARHFRIGAAQVTGIARIVLPFVTGMPRWQSNLVVDLLKAISQGAQETVSSDVEAVTGTAPGTNTG